MDIIRAKEIIAALAEGVDPTTGEVLPDNSVCNKGEIVRASPLFLQHSNIFRITTKRDCHIIYIRLIHLSYKCRSPTTND